MVDASGWHVTASSTAAGWLPVPDEPDPAARSRWVDAARDELRVDWGDRWAPEHEVLVGAALEHALDSRGPEDVLCFQLWPMRLPFAALVHVALIAPIAEGEWDGIAGELAPIELSGVGPGVQRAFAVPAPDGEGQLVGIDLVCSGLDAALLVRLEPTMVDMLAVVAPMVLGLADAIEVTGPDGARLRSLEPAGARVGSATTWSTEETA